MTKLYALKEWLTVPDTARHLTVLLGEEVKQSDVLRLALDGQLTLSVYFVNPMWGRSGRIVPRSEANTAEAEALNDETASTVERIFLDQNNVAELGPEVVPIWGVWDFTMWGVERREVEKRYEELTGGPHVQVYSFDGPLVSRPDGTICQLQEPVGPEKRSKGSTNQFRTFDEIPSDCVWVIRTSALQEFEARLARKETPPKSENSLGSRERTTLLLIIAALARLSKLNLSKPSATATAIESETERMGAPVSARAIENHLKRIPAAMEDRGTQ
jgi:hypothetical protein